MTHNACLTGAKVEVKLYASKSLNLLHQERWVNKMLAQESTGQYDCLLLKSSIDGCYIMSYSAFATTESKE